MLNYIVNKSVQFYGSVTNCVGNTLDKLGFVGETILTPNGLTP